MEIDKTNDPVIVGKVVYAGTNSGRLAAIDITSGMRVWTKKEGAIEKLYVTGCLSERYKPELEKDIQR